LTYGIRVAPFYEAIDLLSLTIVAFLRTPISRSVSDWLRGLGGLGFIPLGILDSSVIPLPGSMDALTIVLSASQRELWPYYALMATLGSVIGGYITYRLARKEGKQALGKLSRSKMKFVEDTFSRWGFGAVAIPAIFPPPVPMVPFLIVAGAAQYSSKKFIVALTVGRVIRYTILAYLAARYGRRMLSLLARHAQTSLWVGLGLVSAIAVVSIFLYLRERYAQARSRAAGK
jgi:membrane protein YqaA with SNARE-associated domain